MKTMLITVLLSTNLGTIQLELDQAKAPVSTKNFVEYVKAGHYNGTIFHRVIPGFMVQGGGMDKTMREKNSRAPIQNEAKNGLKNKKYTVAMARTSDPHSASAQFFINTKDNSFLDYPGQDGWGYAVFGKVTAGMDIVDRIEKVKTGNKGFHQDVPQEAVVIETAAVVEAK